MGFRAIARVTDIDHTTIINWVKEAGRSLSDEPQEDEIPEITNALRAEVTKAIRFAACSR